MGRTSAWIILAVVALAVLVPTVPVCAQQSGKESTEPQEYGEEEFSPFLQNLRRGEIVMFGSFPLTLFFTLEVFDIYRYVYHFHESTRYQYAPWPARPPDAAPYSPREIKVIVVTALSASMLIAVADYIVGRAKEKRPER